ncbi:hypothetical protein LZT28_22980, partial [Aeromonas media]
LFSSTEASRAYSRRVPVKPFCQIDADSISLHDSRYTHSDASSSHFDTSGAGLKGDSYSIKNNGS